MSSGQIDRHGYSPFLSDDGSVQASGPGGRRAHHLPYPCGPVQPAEAAPAPPGSASATTIPTPDARGEPAPIERGILDFPSGEALESPA
ncbi:MAG: hypothetical protein OZSIB_3410 [Candidatus Ozemobacter sibiricus]|uniref:Uncharacterized protein n=1 Tax=Candidatus Ozemobacter sibiricus TaxID=2268124 RepID=A0A367ZQ14_9BACT|nr:MAG: hypothetical protein OZSIB_3410 [Candidatus Ozemobacter sibiricus]